MPPKEITERAQAALLLIFLAGGLVSTAIALERWRDAGRAFARRHRLVEALLQAVVVALLAQPLGIVAWAVTRRNLWILTSFGILFALGVCACVATWSWRHQPVSFEPFRRRAARGFTGVPRIPALPTLPPEHAGPGHVTRLEAEVFARFPDASHFHRIGFGPTPVGEIDILLLWGEKADTTRIVAFFPGPLRFDWEIGALRAAGAAACPQLEHRCSLRSTDEAAACAILESAEVRGAILAVVEAGAETGVSASHVTTEVSGVSGMFEAPVGRTMALVATAAFRIYERAGELGLTDVTFLGRRERAWRSSS